MLCPFPPSPRTWMPSKTLEMSDATKDTASEAIWPVMDAMPNDLRGRAGGGGGRGGGVSGPWHWGKSTGQSTSTARASGGTRRGEVGAAACKRTHLRQMALISDALNEMPTDTQMKVMR
jgi:hypothetical protein